MEATAPISLYIDLEEGESANIEVVARAALAWAGAVRELAYVIDPSIDIEIELVSGTEGSLDLNACIKAVSKFPNQHPKLATIIITSLTWFAVQTGAYTYEKVLDWLLSDKSPPVVHAMTKEEIEAVARDVVKAQEAEIAAAKRRQVFHELNQDQSITGVGSTQERGTRPSAIVPRAQFAERAGTTIRSVEADAKKRTQVSRITAILISPTLKDAVRSWRFQVGSLPEFGANMKDQAFLTALLSGRVSLPLRAGIEMEIELESREELSGDLWIVKERNVTKVFRPEILPDPNQLPFPSHKP